MFVSKFFRPSTLSRFSSLFYNIDHEWIDFDPKTKVGRVGVTDYAQKQLGEIEKIEMPSIGQVFKQGEVMGVVTSDKVIDDIYCPLSGSVIELNHKAIESPHIINTDPEDSGWLLKLKIENLSELDQLYDKDDYMKLLKQLEKRKDSSSSDSD